MLMCGELGVFDITTPVIVSHGNGSKIHNPSFSGRVVCETFLLQVRMSVSYLELQKGRLAILDRTKDKLLQRFVRLEENEVARRLWNANEIIRAPSGEVKRLRKFFADVGKEVAVLPTGKVLELDDVNLIVRTAPSVEFMDNPSYMRLDIVAWEDIGFIYELDKDEELFYARER